MFDGSLPEIGELGVLSDAALVDAAGGWSRSEAAACARKQAVMAEIFVRRTGSGPDERELWWVDPEAAVAAELAAVLNVSAGMALHQTHRGVALRDRLPKVAALFGSGLISDLLVRAIVWRTYLIEDPDAIANTDAALAEQVVAWGPLSTKKTEQAIDALVERFDPGALRRSHDSSQYRDVTFGSPSDEAGYTSMWARLLTGDAKVFEQRVNEIAGSVCEADARTLGERRSDALTALAAGHTELACQCGDAEYAATLSARRPAVGAHHRRPRWFMWSPTPIPSPRPRTHRPPRTRLPGPRRWLRRPRNRAALRRRSSSVEEFCPPGCLPRHLAPPRATFVIPVSTLRPRLGIARRPDWRRSCVAGT